jgi:hypothetical protein
MLLAGELHIPAGLTKQPRCSAHAPNPSSPATSRLTSILSATRHALGAARSSADSKCAPAGTSEGMSSTTVPSQPSAAAASHSTASSLMSDSAATVAASAGGLCRVAAAGHGDREASGGRHTPTDKRRRLDKKGTAQAWPLQAYTGNAAKSLACQMEVARSRALTSCPAPLRTAPPRCGCHRPHCGPL